MAHFNKFARTYIYPLTTMCNTIIGIGIFALPFAAIKVGLPLMLVYLAILGFLVTNVHLMFADLALKTPDYKRMPGFVKIYLGEKWAAIERIISLAGLIGSMVGFMVIGGQFLYF